MNRVTLDIYFKDLKYKPDVIKIYIEGAKIDLFQVLE